VRSRITEVSIRNTPLREEATVKTARAALMIALAIYSFAAMARKPVYLTRIIEQQRAIAVQIQSPETTGLEPRQIEAVRDAQVDVFAAIGDKRGLSELTADEQVSLKNGLEKIDAALKGTLYAERNREKCWREQKLGSKLNVTRCATQQEIDQLREGSREWYEKGDVCIGSCGSAPE
jgi:hypothetical protein